MSEFHFREGRWRKGPGLVPLSDRLWRFGDGFFDTVRVEDGKPCLWVLHEKRLKRSLRTLALPAFDVELFPLPRLVGVAALRIFVSSGTGNALAQRGALTVYASLAPYQAVTKALRVASFVRTERAYADVKTPTYLETIIALRRKRVDDLIACDERGKTFSSRALADHIAGFRDRGERRLVFAIGGADGLDESVRAAAGSTLAFGPQTWPHALARAMLAEQLYRAVTILAGSPYHRD